MGSKAQRAIADGNEAIADALGHIATELRAQRSTLSNISARLGIEVEDRENADTELGRRVIEQEREINRLKVVRGSKP